MSMLAQYVMAADNTTRNISTERPAQLLRCQFLNTCDRQQGRVRCQYLQLDGSAGLAVTGHTGCKFQPMSQTRGSCHTITAAAGNCLRLVRGMLCFCRLVAEGVTCSMAHLWHSTKEECSSHGPATTTRAAHTIRQTQQVVDSTARRMMPVPTSPECKARNLGRRHCPAAPCLRHNMERLGHYPLAHAHRDRQLLARYPADASPHVAGHSPPHDSSPHSIRCTATQQVTADG